MKKNVIIIHLTDRGACSWVRFRFMAGLLETNVGGDVVPVISPFEIADEEVLQRTAAVIVARPMTATHGELVERYRKKRARFGFRVFADFDDMLFDLGEDGIPEYNIFRLDPHKIGSVIENCCSGLDGITVASESLKDAMERRFGFENVSVLPNTVPRFAYGMVSRGRAEKDIEKPRVLYAGSTSHFKPGHLGDFDGPWVPWMRRSAIEGDIDLHFFGFEPPEFLEGAPLTLHPFVPAVAFPQAVASIRPDIYLAPLKDNAFNRCKSDLKLLEASAIGAVLLGSSFDGSPYSQAHPLSLVGEGRTPEYVAALVKDICRKDNFNAILERQDALMENGGRYTESNVSVLRFLKAYMGDAVGVIA